MGSPVIPSTTKTLLPTVTGTFCERMKRLINFPRVLHLLVSYLFKEDGTPTDEFQAAICALGCTGGGGGGGPVNPNMPAPSGVNATDGSFDDKIRVTWNAVTAPSGIAAVTQYKIYRSASSNTDPNAATQVGLVSAPTTQFDDPVDVDLIQGTTYNYWVKATNGTETSAFSGFDVGSASAPTTTMDAVDDLRTTVGFGYGFIALVWTPPTGATKYDVYRHTADDFSLATKIYSDVAPAATTSLLHPTSNPIFWDNVGELVLYDTPMSGGITPSPIPDQDFYYWVVAKKDSPPAVSPESNSSLGRVNAPAIYNGSSQTLAFGDSDTYTVVAGESLMWATLFPSGGGGGGGNAVYGGGGGGGGGIAQEAFAVAEGDVITIVHTPSQIDSGNAAGSANGADGALTELKINGVTVLTSQPGKGGEFSASGGGAGGDGDTASGTTSPTIYDGYPGLPGSGANGGRSGYFFSGRRLPKATTGGSYNGNGAVGSGASAFPANGALAVGGSGLSGSAYLAFGT